MLKWHSAYVIGENEVNTSKRSRFLAWDQGRIKGADFLFQGSLSFETGEGYAHIPVGRAIVLLFMVCRKQSPEWSIVPVSTLAVSRNRFKWKFIFLPLTRETVAASTGHIQRCSLLIQTAMHSFAPRALKDCMEGCQEVRSFTVKYKALGVINLGTCHQSPREMPKERCQHQSFPSLSKWKPRNCLP